MPFRVQVLSSEVRHEFSRVQPATVEPENLEPGTAEVTGFVTERAARRPGMERLSAVPAEARGRGFAGAKPRLNLSHIRFGVCRAASPDGATWRWLACRQQSLEQFRRLLIAVGRFGRHRSQHDVIDRFRNLRVLDPRGREHLTACESCDVARRGRVVRHRAGEHLIHRHAHRVDIAGEHSLPVELFGRHVRRAADYGCAVRGNLQVSRRAEVADLEHPVFGDRACCPGRMSRCRMPAPCAWSTASQI